ncbi:MAG: hypothetical protein ACHBNF_21635 [Chromatiales bacterium]
MKKECLPYEQAEQKLREIKLERRIKRVMRKEGVDRYVAQVRLQELRVEKASTRKERKERIRSAKQAYLQQKNEERIRRYAESKGLSYEAAKVALVALESSIAKAAKSEQRRQRILSDRTHAILNLERSPEVTSGQVAYECRVQHLAAIDRYAPFLPWYKQPFFLRAARLYGEASEHCAPKGQVLAVFASEQTLVAKANRRMLRRAIQRLLSYAKQT